MAEHLNLIPILGVVQRTRARRVYEGYEEWPCSKYQTGPGEHARKILTWIDENTTGQFYLRPPYVAFENEQDFILFKLGYKDE